MFDTTPEVAPPSPLRTFVASLPWICRFGLVLVVGGGLFDLACHLAEHFGVGSLTDVEYGGHVVVLIGMIIALAGVWSIPWQQRRTRSRKETT